jgi:CheY-like chemotaxis protein
MSGDLISLRVLTVFGSARDRDLLRRAAGLTAIPIEIEQADNVTTACSMLAGPPVDVVFVDAAMAGRAALATAARAAARPPFVIVVGAPQRDGGGLDTRAEEADAVVAKPVEIGDAKRMVERCIRPRLPTRVLVVDDSATMRSIIRKILTASRFRLELTEAKEGIEALTQIGSGRFELVFLDYNMPGFNGVETLALIKRQNPKLEVVMISSAPDSGIAARAKTAGAAAFLRKPFYPTDLDAVLRKIFGLRVRR